MKKKIYAIVAAVAAVCALGLFGCASDNGSQAAAKVGDAAIPESKVTAKIVQFRDIMDLEDQDEWGKWLAETGYTPESYREETIDALVETEVLRQAAAHDGITVDQAEVDEYMDSMKEMYNSDEEWKKSLEESNTTEEEYTQEIEDSLLQEAVTEKLAAESGEVSDQELLEYFNESRDFYDGAKRSSAILFSEQDGAEAQRVLDRINAGEITFADAAKEYSIDGEAEENGGDMGWDAMTAQSDSYADALQALQPGQVSAVVDTEDGKQIIMCTEMVSAPADLTDVAAIPESLANELRETIKLENSYDKYYEWLDGYRDGLTIEIIPMPSGLSYAVDMEKYKQYATTDEDVDVALDDESIEDEELEGDLIDEGLDEDALAEDELLDDDIDLAIDELEEAESEEDSTQQ